MSVKVDVDKSTKARTDGNASFKKGRWTEAIGHYTTAIVYNPQDGLGYTNRAAAYLKIDKWRDAERDCTTALEVAKDAGQANVKALYRRALARKALDNVAGAIADIEGVLLLEPTNETAKEEKVELEGLRVKAAQVHEAKSRTAKTLPPSPPRNTETLKPNTTQIEPQTVPPIVTRPDEKEPEGAPSLAKGGSFADLKKGRQTGRRTFATPTPTSDINKQSQSSPSSPSSLALEQVSIADNSTHSPHPVTITPTADLPLLNPLAPGSALSFVSSIRRYPASTTLTQLKHLSARPDSLARMLDTFLEPDQLALILRRLKETLDLDLANAEFVRRFVMGLTQTRRWAMTSIMLSKQERELGQQVWVDAGGRGDWAERHSL